jgi:putative NADPH-quinone reductase
VARLVAVKTSLRPGANSSILLAAAVEGARSSGAEVELVDLAKRRIAPCRACDACSKTGRCRFTDDDLMPILDAIWEAGCVLVATPVYYMSAPAQLKALIDRTQCLYRRKYTLKDRLHADDIARRRGGAIAVCGSRLPNAFDGLDLTMKYFFDSLQMTWAEKLYVAHVEEPAEIERSPEQLARARELGSRLVGGRRSGAFGGPAYPNGRGRRSGAFGGPAYPNGRG